MKAKLDELAARLEKLLLLGNFDAKKQALAYLKTQSEAPGLWQDQTKAKTILKQLTDLQTEVDNLQQLQDKINSAREIVDAVSEADLNQLETELAKLEKIKWLSGPYDRGGAIISIHSGQGGTEAMDWTAMLKRMYLRYAERKNWKSLMGIILQKNKLY